MPQETLGQAILSDEELERSIARMRPSHRVWFNAFIQDPARSASAACKVAGLGRSNTARSSIGARFKRKYAHVIEAYDLRMQAAAILSPREVQERLATIARDEANTRVSDRLKALELIARIHGMLQDKLDVDVAMPQLRRALGGLIGVGSTHSAISSGRGALPTLPEATAEQPFDAEVSTLEDAKQRSLKGSIT